MLFRNTAAQSSSILLATVLSFLLTPLMFARLGLTQFGIWAVTGALINYAQVTALGVTNSLSRFVAYHDGRGDRHAIEECLGLGLITVALVGTASGVAAVLCAPLLAHSLGASSTEDMRVVVVCAWFMFAITLLRGVLGGVPVGLRRMVPPAVASNVGVITNFVASVVALLLSRDLVVYALANAGASVVALAATYIAFRYVWRPARAAIPSRERVREVLAFGLKSQSTWVAEQVNNQTDKVIVALLVNVRAAAAYEIASRVANAVKAVGVLTVSAIIPTATAEIARRGTRVLHEYYGRYTQRTIAIAFPICVAAAIAAPYLFVAWLGEVPDGTLAVMIVLTGAHFVSLTSGVATTVSIAAGDPGLVATNAMLVAAVNLALTAALAPIFGLWGVLAGTFGAITAGTLLFIARFQRKWRIEPRAFSRAVALPASLALGLAVPIVAVEILLDSAPETRLTAGLVTLAVATAYLVPYWVLASRTGILPAQLTYGAVLGRVPRPTPAAAAAAAAAAGDTLHNGSAPPGGSADGSDSEPGAQAGDSAASISGR